MRVYIVSNTNSNPVKEPLNLMSISQKLVLFRKKEKMQI